MVCYLEGGLVKPQDTLPLTVSPVQVSRSPERSAMILTVLVCDAVRNLPFRLHRKVLWVLCGGSALQRDVAHCQTFAATFGRGELDCPPSGRTRPSRDGSADYLPVCPAEQLQRTLLQVVGVTGLATPAVLRVLYLSCPPVLCMSVGGTLSQTEIQTWAERSKPPGAGPCAPKPKQTQ